VTITAYQQHLAEQALSELRYSKSCYDKLLSSDSKHPALALMADSLYNMEAFRQVKNTAIYFLQQIAAEPCRTATLLAQGILWAESSCRIDGTMAMALRNGSAASAAQLLDAMASAECDTMADAARWLNANRTTVLEVLR
jgi:hypothetical protein